MFIVNTVYSNFEMFYNFWVLYSNFYVLEKPMNKCIIISILSACFIWLNLFIKISLIVVQVLFDHILSF